MADRRPVVRVGVAVLAVVAVGAGTAAVVEHTRDHPPATTATGVRTATATVVRTDLATSIQVNGTLGYSGTYAIANEATGTYTALPAIGAVVSRGQQLYEVDGRPVVLFYGARPEWRPLALGVPDGPDVAQLKQNLNALGFGNLYVDNHFDSATYWAVRRWQAAVGTPVTGAVGLADLAYGPGAIQVSALQASLGDQARPGPVLQATGTEQIVNLSVPVAQLYLVKVGQVVSVIMPDGVTTVPGTVTSVSTVAAAGGQDGQGGGPQPTGNQAPATTASATVRLSRPSAAGSFRQAPVVVNVTDQSVHGVLAVPVNALVALREGGYGVWLLDHGNRRLVGVHTGLFSDTLVQVSGNGIAAGATVEVPAS